MTIIDSHIHIGLQDFFQTNDSTFPYDLCNTYENTVSLMDANGVHKAVIIPVPHKDCNVELANEYVYRAYSQYPDRFIPFCRIDEKLEQNLNLGFKGVKIHLVYEELEIRKIKRELQTIEDAGIPILLHAMFKNKVKQIQQILDIAPDLKIILAHMGRGHLYTDEQVVENAIGLRDCPNVYMDTSTVGDIHAIINACEIIGFHRVLYGSDYPFGKNMFKDSYRYDSEITQLIDALDSKEASMIFHENITHLLDKHSENKIRVRKARHTDYDKIIDLIDQLDETDKKFLALSSKYSVIRQNIKNERHCYVAYLNEEILGFLRESGRLEGFSLLEEIIVSPMHRNQGIATTMLDYYHKRFSKNLAKTNTKNLTMIHLLKKFNYIAENPDSPRIINWIRKGDKYEKA